MYSTIIIPSRPQPDTVVAIYLLKTFGKEKFKNIENARIRVQSKLEKDVELYNDDGCFLLDIGGGIFDHHNKNPKTWVSKLVAENLEISNLKEITKLLEYTKRDDMFGKGTISEDPLDRAFGLSGLIVNLNKQYPDNPQKVIEIVLPLIEAHHREEVRRTKELPEELEQRKKAGQVQTFEVMQKNKKLFCIIIESENMSMPGFLRSNLGGNFDVVVQRFASGHTNVLTKPQKQVDLSCLAMVLRLEEAAAQNKEFETTRESLMSAGKISEIEEWYYDTATNSIQNGGSSPDSVRATSIKKEDLKNILFIGLTQKI